MRIAFIGLLLGSLCLAACDDTTDAVVVHVPRPGPFVLRTLNNQALPAVIFDSVAITPRFRLEVISGGFSINGNGTFSNFTQLRDTRGLIIVFRTVVCSGTFTLTGRTFTFVQVGGPVECDRIFTGVVAGDVLSTTLRGFPAVYSGGTFGTSVIVADASPTLLPPPQEELALGRVAGLDSRLGQANR
jgi:hypothetical protein